MKKVIILCISIVIIVIVSDIIIKNDIYSNFDYMISVLNKIDKMDDNIKKNKEIEAVDSISKEKYLLMAFYIDHSELEKIRTQIVIIKAGIDELDNSFLHEEIQETIFIIEHLKEKIDFKLENIL